MLLTATQLEKTYDGGETPVQAVRGVDLACPAGEFVALVGPSGCGKSTLLHLCGAMDRPTRGRIALEGRALDALPDDELTMLRRTRIGFVFQFFNLLPTLTVVENVALPLRLAGARSHEAEQRAREAAEHVGLGHRLRHYPQQLSGGEMQRTAIARAVVHRPVLLIADEPTGNLDSATGARVLDLLESLNRDLGLTMLLATHADDVAARAHRVIHMRDGRIEREHRAAS